MQEQKENLAAQTYALVRQIPKGQVCTYGLLAALLGRPRAARVIGTILSRCPEGENVPCHRVIKHDGSLCGSDPYHMVQHTLLREEGVPFLPDGRVHIKACCWGGPFNPQHSIHHQR